MPVVVQVSIVVATIAFVALAIVAIRAIRRFERTAERVSTAVDSVNEVVAKVKTVTDEAQGIVASLRGIVPPIQRTARGFEQLGQRVLGLSTTVVEEIAAPIGVMAAMVHGVRAGAGTLISRLKQKTSHFPNGGYQS